MGYFGPKNILFRLKHTQRIYLTLLSTICVKIHQITYVIFETIRHFSHFSSVFFHFKYYILSIKVQIFRLSTARVKVHQILHYIILQCHETYFFCTFSSESLYALDKRSPSKCKFPEFRLFARKLTLFLI